MDPYTMPAGVRRRALVVVLASVAACALAGVAPAGNGGFLPPSGDSPNAEGISDLYIVVLVIAGIVLLLVEGALILFAVRYRRSRRARGGDATQVRTSGRAQLAFVVAGAVVVAAVAIATF